MKSCATSQRPAIALILVGISACQPLTPFGFDSGLVDAGSRGGGVGVLGGGSSFGGGTGGGTGGGRTGGGAGGGSADAGRDAGLDAGFTVNLVATSNQTSCFLGVTGVDTSSLYLTSDAGIFRYDGVFTRVSDVPATAISAQGTTVYAASDDAGLQICEPCTQTSSTFAIRRFDGVTVGVCSGENDTFVVTSPLGPQERTTAVWRRRNLLWSNAFWSINVEYGTSCAVSANELVFVGNDSAAGEILLADGGLESENENLGLIALTRDDTDFVSMATLGDHFLIGSRNGTLVERIRTDNYVVRATGGGLSQQAYSMFPIDQDTTAVATRAGGGTHLLVSSSQIAVQPGSAFIEVRGVWARNKDTYFLAGCQSGTASLWKASR